MFNSAADILSTYGEEEEDDDGESDQEGLHVPELVDTNILDEGNEQEYNHHWNELRKPHENLAHVTTVPPDRLRAMGTGDDYNLVRVSMDISKVQAIPRHNESLLLAHQMQDSDGSARSMTSDANQVWIGVVSGLLMQIMAFIPYWEIITLPW